MFGTSWKIQITSPASSYLNNIFCPLIEYDIFYHGGNHKNIIMARRMCNQTQYDEYILSEYIRNQNGDLVVNPDLYANFVRLKHDIENDKHRYKQ